MSVVYTLELLLSDRYELSPASRAFCEALLGEGEVLAVGLSYLPETLLWLVTRESQARFMRAHRAASYILTLAEARDLFVALGDPGPVNLMEVAGRLSSAAPGSPPGDGNDEEDDDL